MAWERDLRHNGCLTIINFIIIINYNYQHLAPVWLADTHYNLTSVMVTAYYDYIAK